MDYLAWTAGIIDGEGCLSIHRQCRPHEKSFAASISVKMKEKECIDTLWIMFGGRRYTMQYKSANGRRGTCYCWYLQKRDIIRFLNLLHPYLVGKQEQASLVLELRRRIEDRKGLEMQNQPNSNLKCLHITKEELQIREGLKNKIQALHRKGGAYARTFTK